MIRISLLGALLVAPVIALAERPSIPQPSNIVETNHRKAQARFYRCKSVLNSEKGFELKQPAGADLGRAKMIGLDDNHEHDAMIAWGFHNLTFVVLNDHGGAYNVTINTDNGSYTYSEVGTYPDFGHCDRHEWNGKLDDGHQDEHHDNHQGGHNDDAHADGHS
jgi:hypothetical protein